MIKKLLPYLRWLLRYLRWWADDHGDNRILFTGPLSVLVGTIGVVPHWSLPTSSPCLGPPPACFLVWSSW